MPARSLPCVLLLLACAQALALEPARGRLLVATPELRDPNFSRTVVLLLDYGREGAVGLVVNRPGRLGPAELLPDVAELAAYDGKVYFGGPVALRSMRMLLRGRAARGATRDEDDDGGEGGSPRAVFGDVVVSSDPGLLRRVAASGRGAESVRLYLGYAGWSAGQLDREIAADAWTVVEARSELVFSTEPLEVWERLASPPDAISVERTAPGGRWRAAPATVAVAGAALPATFAAVLRWTPTRGFRAAGRRWRSR